MDEIWTFDGDYQFLSNFFKFPVRIGDGLTYPTSEHAYQACKTTSMDERRRIAGASTAGAAKKIGQTVTLRSDWEDTKIEFMRHILSVKFSPGGVLAIKLNETGDARLYEGNTWGDSFWGVDLRSGRGQNHLGKLLEERRRLNREAIA